MEPLYYEYQVESVEGVPSGMYTAVQTDKKGIVLPAFRELDQAIDFINSNKIFGHIQRYAVYARERRYTQLEIDCIKRTSPYLSLWVEEMAKPTYRMTAGIAWIGKGVPTSIVTWLTNKRQPYKEGYLLDENPEGIAFLEAVCEIAENAEQPE